MVNAKVVTDFATKLPKGYGKSKDMVGFVSYDDPKAALMAVQVMDGFTVLGKKLKVTIRRNDLASHPPQEQ